LTVKLFIFELHVNKAYKELDLSYNTIHKICTKIDSSFLDFVIVLLFSNISKTNMEE